MIEAEPTGERNLPTWTPMTSSPRDQAELISLKSEIYGEEFDADFDLALSPTAGLLLRHQNRAVGYVLFEIDTLGDRKILNIEEVQVLQRARNPVVMAELIRILRTYAKEQNVTHVHWTAGSDEMIHLSQKVDAEFEGVFLVPLEQFNLDLFTGGI